MRRVTALIVNYNAGGLLARCVDSLVRAGVDRVLVGDNASTDGSLATIAGVSAVTIEAFDRNLGYGVAMNHLSRRVDSHYVLLCNPDVEVDRECVDRLMRALDADVTAMVAGARIVGADGNEQRATRRRRPGPWRSLVTALGLEKWLAGVNDVSTCPRKPTPMFGVSGALLLFRTADWRELGGFDETYFLHCEDLDLFARIMDDHRRYALFTPDAHALHAHGYSHRGVHRASSLHKYWGMRRYYATHEAPRIWPGMRWLWPTVLTIRFVAHWPINLYRDVTFKWARRRSLR